MEVNRYYGQGARLGCAGPLERSAIAPPWPRPRCYLNSARPPTTVCCKHLREVGVSARFTLLFGVPRHAKGITVCGGWRACYPCSGRCQRKDGLPFTSPHRLLSPHVSGASRADAPSINLPEKVRISGGRSGSSIRSISIDTAASVIRRTGWRIVERR